MEDKDILKKNEQDLEKQISNATSNMDIAYKEYLVSAEKYLPILFKEMLGTKAKTKLDVPVDVVKRAGLEIQELNYAQIVNDYLADSKFWVHKRDTTQVAKEDDLIESLRVCIGMNLGPVLSSAGLIDVASDNDWEVWVAGKIRYGGKASLNSEEMIRGRQRYNDAEVRLVRARDRIAEIQKELRDKAIDDALKGE